MAFRRTVDWLAAAWTATALCVTTVDVRAQSGTPGLVDKVGLTSGLYAGQYANLSYLDSSGKAKQPGKRFSETLRSGSNMLSHGGIIPSTLRVSVGSRTLRDGTEYFLDAANGMIGFSQPIKSTESVRVSYRYVEGADETRSPLSFQGLALNLRGTSLNLGYNVTTDKAKGLDFSTYGLSLNSGIGKGAALNGLLYISSPTSSRHNLIDDLSTAQKSQLKKADPKDAVTDHLIAQNLNLKSGAGTFRATYQDVGQQFSGFQAMRLANAGKSDILSQIGALEKEKGVKRLGFGGGLNLNKKDTAGVDWDQISDGKDTISKQALSLKSSAFNFGFSQRTIGANFTRFNDLREEDRAQMAKEKGITRKDISLGLNPSKGTLLGFNQSSFVDKQGGLTLQSFNYAAKGLGFSMSNRAAGKGFGRFNDLAVPDKTALALDIRRQYNPNAAAAEVTAKDLEQVGLESGLKRDRMTLTTGLGKTGTFAFNQFGINDETGSISRQTLNLSTKKLTVNFLDQRISQSFGRLGKMSDFEKAQLANEKGIHKTSLNLKAILTKTSTLTFNNLGVSDIAGGMMRRSLDYGSKGFLFNLNMGETDKSFSRAMDLALPEAERKAIEAERGFKKMDLTAKVTAFKGLTLDAYNSSAQNAQDQLAKGQFKYGLAWQANKTTSVNFLSEGSTFKNAGTVFDRRLHDLFSIDHVFRGGLKLAAFHDTLETIAAGAVKPDLTTDYLHLEMNRTKPLNWLAELKRVAMSDGKFENTEKFDLNLPANKNLSLHLSEVDIDRGKDPSAETETLEWKWKMAGGVSFTGMAAETHTNNDTDVNATQMAVSAPANKEVNVAVARTEVEQEQQPTKSSSDVAFSNAKPLNAFGMKKVVVTAKYSMLNDKSKKQSEATSGRICGLIGNHQLALDYGGALDPKGMGAIARAISFITDRNPKLPFHLDMLYKARNVNHGELRIVRKYNAALALDKKLTATYTYTSLPEDAAGVMQLTKNSVFALKHPINKKMNLSLDYITGEDLAKNTNISKIAAMVSGKLDTLTAVQGSYSADVNKINGQGTDSHTFSLSYDKQIDGDHFIKLTTSYVMYGGHQCDDIQATIDFKTRF